MAYATQSAGGPVAGRDAGPANASASSAPLAAGETVRRDEIDRLRSKLDWLEGSMSAQWMERVHKQLGQIATRDDLRQTMTQAVWPVVERMKDVPSRDDMGRAIGEAIGVAVAAAIDQSVTPLLNHMHELAIRNDEMMAQITALRTLADEANRDREWLKTDLEQARLEARHPWWRNRRRRRRLSSQS